jgi:hypothetical protein
MIKTKLEGIKYLLENSIPLFNGNGHINIRGREQAVKGIEDDIPNYFLLDYQEDSEQYSIEPYENLRAKEVTVDLQLLVKTTGKDLGSVSEAVLSVLYGSCSNISDVTVSQSVEYISEVYGYETPCDLDLILIKFTETFAASLLSNCVNIICKEKSC